MNPVFLEDNDLRRMERFLDMSTKRQALISSNISNVDTPGYKTLDVNFESELTGAMEAGGVGPAVTNGRHITGSVDSDGQHDAVAEEVKGLTLRNDLNNVNIDREMSRMSMNGVMFSAVTLLVSTKFRMLKTAITGG